MAPLPAPKSGANTLENARKAGIERALHYAAAETAETTRKAYGADWRHFREWCEDRSETPVPASITAVALYLADLADAGLKTSTIHRRVAAIHYFHRHAGHDSPTKSEPIRAVLAGIRREIGTAATQKAPATAQIVARMLKQAPITLIGRRDRAILALGFATALRRSELAALDLADLEWTDKGLLVHIRRSKTDQEGEGQTIAVPAGKKLRPLDAVRDWIAAAGLTSGPLFRSIGKGGRINAERLTDRSIANIVKAYAERAGLDPAQFAGHSLRAGFVTSALAAGADMFRVMDVTRQRRIETLKRYDRRAKAFDDHAGKAFL